MPNHLSIETLQKNLIFEDLWTAPLEKLVEQLMQRSRSADNLPESHYQIDPRDGKISIFSASRAKRIHTAPAQPTPTDDGKTCPICAGNLTNVCHIQPLSTGAAFITENLYPVVYPHGLAQQHTPDVGSHAIMRGGDIFGGHFLQWTSSVHEHDWHNMPLEDLILTMQQLAMAERKLLCEALAMPRAAGSRGETRGYLSIFKNFGTKAGASLSHGHQQLLFSNLMSVGSFNDWRFYGRHCETYSDYILRENSENLLVKDYGEVVLLVPYFMSRPYELQAIVKQSHHSYLFHLNDRIMADLTQAMRDAIRGITSLLAQDGKPVAFNFTIHSGPGCGLYVDFLPRADATAGLELQGVWVCHALPATCAERLRQYIEG
jgi:galactose-1-phosphate uridylyltransferase